MLKNKLFSNALPTVSILTITFNRRPFIPTLFDMYNYQDYPKDKMELILLDDGTDKIEDLIAPAQETVHNLRYYKIANDEKWSIGKKRNYINSLAKGDILIYFDDDDLHHWSRVSHSVEYLSKSNQVLCAGSNFTIVAFQEPAINQIYQFGPYDPHSRGTAGTFAFKRHLLSISQFNDEDEMAEEAFFLKNFTIPFVQLNPLKTILVFSHIHNTIDKKYLLNPEMFASTLVNKVDRKVLADYFNHPCRAHVETMKRITRFFTTQMPTLLEAYPQGLPDNKPLIMSEIQKKLGEKQEVSVEMYQSAMRELIQIIKDQNKRIETLEKEKQTIYS